MFKKLEANNKKEWGLTFSQDGELNIIDAESGYQGFFEPNILLNSFDVTLTAHGQHCFLNFSTISN